MSSIELSDKIDEFVELIRELARSISSVDLVSTMELKSFRIEEVSSTNEVDTVDDFSNILIKLSLTNFSDEFIIDSLLSK
jgi:hypothetical protein